MPAGSIGSVVSQSPAGVSEFTRSKRSAVQELKRAFEALEVAAGGTPWMLTDNFVSALHEGRGRLALSGPGDPTGRGLGFSYMRDDRRVRPSSV